MKEKKERDAMKERRAEAGKSQNIAGSKQQGQSEKRSGQMSGDTGRGSTDKPQKMK